MLSSERHNMGLKSGITSENGFTLVEILISLAIFAILVLAVSQLTVSNIKSGSNVEFYNQAIALADNKMETLKKFSQEEPYATVQRGYDWFISKGSNYNGQGIPGYLAGVAGVGGAAGTEPEAFPMYDNGVGPGNGVTVGDRGDATANDAIYTATDWINLDTMVVSTYCLSCATVGAWQSKVIKRVWTITPVTTGTPPPAPTPALFDAYDQTGAVDNNNGTCAQDNVKATVTTYWIDIMRKNWPDVEANWSHYINPADPLYGQIHRVTLESYIPRRRTL